MSEISLYWLTRLDYINDFLCIVVFLSLFIMVCLAWEYHEETCKDMQQKLCADLKFISIVFVSSLTLFFLIPSTKEMAFIVLTPKIINNSELKKLPVNVAKLLNKDMEKYIKNFD